MPEQRYAQLPTGSRLETVRSAGFFQPGWAGKTVERYRKNQKIFCQGDVADAVFFSCLDVLRPSPGHRTSRTGKIGFATRILSVHAAMEQPGAMRIVHHRDNRDPRNKHLMKRLLVIGFAACAFALAPILPASAMPSANRTALLGTDNSIIQVHGWGHHGGWGHHYGWARGHHYGHRRW
jgi:hypothetical protein